MSSKIRPLPTNELERVRVQQQTRIKSENNQPQGIAVRTLPPLAIWQGRIPYGGPQTGSGYAETVATISKADVSSPFHQGWIHPVEGGNFCRGRHQSERNQAAMLEKRFGKWKPAPRPPRLRKNFAALYLRLNQKSC